MTYGNLSPEQLAARMECVLALTDPEAAFVFLNPGNDEAVFHAEDAIDVAALMKFAIHLPEMLFEMLVEFIGTEEAATKFLSDYLGHEVEVLCPDCEAEAEAEEQKNVGEGSVTFGFNCDAGCPCKV